MSTSHLFWENCIFMEPLSYVLAITKFACLFLCPYQGNVLYFGGKLTRYYAFHTNTRNSHFVNRLKKEITSRVVTCCWSLQFLTWKDPKQQDTFVYPLCYTKIAFTHGRKWTIHDRSSFCYYYDHDRNTHYDYVSVVPINWKKPDGYLPPFASQYVPTSCLLPRLLSSLYFAPA